MPETTEYRLKWLEDRVKENEEKNSRQHKEFYDLLGELGTAQAVAIDRHTSIMSRLDSIADDVRILREKPGRRWESVVGYIAAAIVTGIVGIIIGTLANRGGV